MDFKNLLADDAGVSPVIGVILMVAITVILAAVIGTFVLNNNNLNDAAPQVNWDYSVDETNDVVEVTHEGGDDVENSTISYSSTASGSLQAAPTPDFGSTVSAGSTEAIGDDDGTAGSPYTDGDLSSGAIQSGATLRIIWTSPEGGSSSTIGTYEIP